MSALDHKPHITMDDGADLVTTALTKRTDVLDGVIAGTEETTTGVIRLRAMAKQGVLRYPIIAVNDADTKHLFDNRYGTGQSTIDGIIRATNFLLAGAKFVVAGYGWCGRGLASRARGLGAEVIVTEIDPTKAIEAVMDGFRVMSMDEAAKIGDVFCTVTGNKSVLRKRALRADEGRRHRLQLRPLQRRDRYPGAGEDVVVEAHHAPDRRGVLAARWPQDQPAGRRPPHQPGRRRRPSAVGDGHELRRPGAVGRVPGEEPRSLEKKVYVVPEELDKRVARLKLESMGIKIDRLTPEQEEYLASWNEGT